MTQLQTTSLLSAFQTYIALFLPQGLFLCSDLYLGYTFPRNSHGSFPHFILVSAHMSPYHRNFSWHFSIWTKISSFFYPLTLLYIFFRSSSFTRHYVLYLFLYPFSFTIMYATWGPRFLTKHIYPQYLEERLPHHACSINYLINEWRIKFLYTETNETLTGHTGKTGSRRRKETSVHVWHY